MQQIAIALAALSAVLALIWAVQHFLRGGMLRNSSTGRLRILQMIALDPKRRVILMQCDGNELLVLTGGQNDLLLSTPVILNAPERPAERAA